MTFFTSLTFHTTFIFRGKLWLSGEKQHFLSDQKEKSRHALVQDVTIFI